MLSFGPNPYSLNTTKRDKTLKALSKSTTPLLVENLRDTKLDKDLILSCCHTLSQLTAFTYLI